MLKHLVVVAAAVLLGIVTAGVDGRAQGGAAQPRRESGLYTMPVQGNVHVIIGAGSNITVQVGNLGAVLVDTGTAQNADAVLASLRQLTPRPALAEFIVNEAAIRTLGLTPRECDILRQLASGQSNKELARSLGISPNTVKTHVARLYEKADAARWSVPEASFSQALAASATKMFPNGSPPARELEQYLDGLHLQDLALACACVEGSDAAWEHFILEHRPLLYRCADALLPGGGARELADSL